MAKASVEVIQALRLTAKKITESNDYQWGHMGACNCGFLAQQVTALTKNEIHSNAMEGHGDWSEQLNDYCPTSGLKIDNLISELISFGFDTDDLKHLERLSDAKVLRMLIVDNRNLKHNIKSDVCHYLNTWANLLEAELIKTIDVSALNLDQLNYVKQI